jgi:hypothetical protein
MCSGFVLNSQLLWGADFFSNAFVAFEFVWMALV